MNNLDIYKGKRVLVTGHTGFKGTWLCKELVLLGADVVGYALDSPTDPALYDMSGLGSQIVDIRGDIRGFDGLQEVIKEYKPEIIIHMAAQTIVLEGYQNPRETYETNLMGTVNLLECIRRNTGSDTKGIKAFVNITTDKVYKNNPSVLREEDSLDGFDPYSNSKSCSELATWTYKRSSAEFDNIGVITLRSGNTIGGGDFGKDRLVPDIVKAAMDGSPVAIRNPEATRPYQHVAEVVTAYLIIASKLYQNEALSGAYNIGPVYGATSNGELAKRLCDVLDVKIQSNDSSDDFTSKPVEALTLDLDIQKAKDILGWESTMTLDQAVKEITDFTQVLREGGDIGSYMDNYISEYIRDRRNN